MIYFVSDVHLGSLIVSDRRKHELQFVKWLDMIRADATVLYLMGDIFDFWFEYKTVVPKGYTRVLGKLAEMADSGIEIHFMIGNHDLWVFDYFQKEIGMQVHYDSVVVEHAGKQFFLAHGDGLMVEEKRFQLLRKVFHSKLSQRLFALVPPYIGQNLGYAWSKSNREHLVSADYSYKGENNEYLIQFAKKHCENNHINYYIFGHRHLDLLLQLRNKSQVLILGDFISIFSYGVFDGNELRLEYFER